MGFVEIKARKAARIFLRDIHENTFTILSSNLKFCICMYICVYIYIIYVFQNCTLLHSNKLQHKPVCMYVCINCRLSQKVTQTFANFITNAAEILASFFRQPE